MTTQQKTSRADAVRQRRSSQKRSKSALITQGIPIERGQAGIKQTSRTSRQVFHPESVFLPGKPRPVAPATFRQTKGTTLRQAFGVSSPAKGKGSPIRRMTKDPHHTSTRFLGKGYDFAFSLGRTAVRAPLLNLPNLGSRWVSAGLTLLLALLIYTMATANTFKVAAVELIGNQRLTADDVNTRLGLTGQPIFNAVPSQIEKNLRISFSDLAGVSVQIGFPNHIRVSVVERTPILAWYQDGKTTWIDTSGIAFTPRGDVPGLVQIASSGTPPTPATDPQKSMYDQSFIAPAMVQAILTLYPQVPGGAPMVYDPKYGMGWQDPRGWSVYFGQNTQDIVMKKQIYQAILDTFSREGIQPTLISVAYLDAPFYK